jgi:dolichyl-diphosphooligosaccharide--protein glycosyltransferase
VRLISGSTSAGMFSALFFAFCPAIIQRGNLGWFKSEPLGLFLGLLATYLFLSALKHKEIKYMILKSAAAGITLGLANASWGGVQYFCIPISLFLITIPFFRRDLKIAICASILLTSFTLITAIAFPRPGISFIFGLPGIALIGSTVFLINAHYLKKLSTQQKEIRNTIFLLIAFAVIAIATIIAGAYYSSDFRYLNAISPFLSPQISVTQFVAEHTKPTLVDYFVYHSVLLFFAGFGAWNAFRHKNEMLTFALILGITGVYVSGGLVRLLVYASVGISILAGIGLYYITRSILQTRRSDSLHHIDSDPNTIAKSPKSVNRHNVKGDKLLRLLKNVELWHTENSLKFVYTISLILIILVPVIYPDPYNWLSLADVPPTIIDAGKGNNVQRNDWLNALNWISKNTSKDAVIAASWDYGYWITTLGNRTTLADNANMYPARTATIAKMFIDNTQNGITIASEKLNADYILIYIVAQPVLINDTLFYVLGNGGDESKVSSMAGVAGFDENKYINRNEFTDQFWNNTLLGKLMPFTLQGYFLFDNGKPTLVSDEFMAGSIPVYLMEIKCAVNHSTDESPLDLVYSSPSFAKKYSSTNNDDSVALILIYKVNHDSLNKYNSDFSQDPVC